MIKIAGVPEHFNYPFFADARDDLFVWKTAKGGSGQMREMLLNGEVDMTLMLSEAALKMTKEHPEFHIAGTYIETPLRWGVFTRSDSKNEFSDQDILNSKVGISRFNSGSHLMMCYEALQRGIDLSKLQFHIVNSLDGAREAFRKGEVDLFLWEEQMCKFLVESEEWKQIGLVSGSWPAFVMVKKTGSFDEEFESLKAWLGDWTQKLNNHFELNVSAIAEMFSMDEEDLISWQKKVKWSENFKILTPELREAKDLVEKVLASL